MPLVRLSGEALCWHTAIFCARRCLEDMKKVEADRLLDLHRAAFDPVLPDVPDLDIAATPEILQDTALARRAAARSRGPSYDP
jgi:hypothetical protein